MPPPSKNVKHMRELAQKAGAAVKISEEARAAHKARPPIVMQGSKDLQLSVVRHEKPRRAQKEANDAWLRACEAWPQLQLKCIVGNAENPEGDYGAVGALFEFESRDHMPAYVTRSGVCFLGLPSCKKKGQSTEFVPVKHRPFMPLLKDLLVSIGLCEFQAYWPRVSGIVGAHTGWHVDNNTRGGQPNAHRALDPGGCIRLCKEIDFRCSIISWEGTYMVPWGLDSERFRYMEWDGDGRASITDAPAALYWQMVEVGSCTVGLLECCLVDVKAGAARACPIVDVHAPCELPERATDLQAVGFDTLMAQARRQPTLTLTRNPELNPNLNPPP